MSNISITQMIANSPAENRVLLYSARRFLSEPEKERLCLLLRNPIDWDLLCASATAHGSMPLLFRSLNSLPKSALPGPQLRDIGRHFVSNAVRSRKLANCLFGILDLLAAHNILAVPYKGPALAAAAYSDLTLRISGDLDILIPLRHVRSATRLLLDQGFRLHDKPIGSAGLDLRSEYHLEFYHPADGPPLELHWKFCDDLDFPVDMDRCFARLESQPFLGRCLQVFSPEETLIGLCIHGTKDLWNRLILVADISEFIRSRPQLDWQRLFAIATTPDAMRMLAVALRLARDLMELGLPADLSHTVDADPVAKTLAQRVAARLIARRTTIVRPPERVPFALAVRRCTHARTKYLANYLRILCTPDELDFAFITLPRSLSILYYLVHPLRRSLIYCSLFLAKLRKSKQKAKH